MRERERRVVAFAANDDVGRALRGPLRVVLPSAQANYTLLNRFDESTPIFDWANSSLFVFLEIGGGGSGEVVSSIFVQWKEGEEIGAGGCW